MNDFAMQRGLEIRRKKGDWRGERHLGGDALPEDWRGVASRPLGCAAAAGGELANVVEEDGALELVELRGVHGDLSEEGIGHEDRGLVAMARVGVSQEGGDVDLKGAGQAIERRQGRYSLAVLDLRDVGAGNAHAGGELPLREIAHVAQVANGGGYLKSAFCCWGRGDDCERSGSWFGLLDLEGFVAAAAQSVRCPKLHQTAMITTQDLTLFDGCHHSCHKLS
jgi:hypothetical protein